MKNFVATFVITLGMIPNALALDPAINCLQWKLGTERAYVTKVQATMAAKQTLKYLKKFGFNLETTERTATHRSYYFRYNRDEVLSQPQTLREFESAIFQHSRNLQSQLGYTFECTFHAPTPWPRISGSSVN